MGENLFQASQWISSPISSAVLDAGKGGAIPLFPLPAQGSLLDSEQALVIRHPSVVADPDLTFDPCDIDGDGNLGNPDGAWTFKTLMTAMANESRTGISRPKSLCASGWPAGKSTDLVNDDVVPAREHKLDLARLGGRARAGHWIWINLLSVCSPS